MRKVVLLLAILNAAVVGTLFAAPAEAAAEATRHFRIEYGQTYTEGTVTFYNQSVRVVGEHKAISQATSGCRATQGIAHKRDGTWMGEALSAVICSGSHRFAFTVPAEQPGGASYLQVRFLRCQRATGPCFYGQDLNVFR